MTMNTTTAAMHDHSERTTSVGLNVALWISQALLALVFGMSGGMKVFTPAVELAKNLAPMASFPIGLVRFIGISELAGAVGVLLPALTRIKPRLTALAGLGLLVVMILAAGFHIARGELNVVAVPVVLGGIAAFVAWGRYRRAAITPRQ
jgi:membrane protease YdiL (CAAX protease family)